MRSVSIVGLALSLCMALGLVACGGTDASSAAAASSANNGAASTLPFAPKSFAKLDTAVAVKSAGNSFAGAGGNGFYWDNAQAGTGLFFEAQGSRGLLAIAMYDNTGEPIWYFGEGEMTDGGGGAFTYRAQLHSYAGGQALTGPWKAPTATGIGEVVIAFSGATAGNGSGVRAEVRLPGGRVWNVQRWSDGLSFPGSPTQPEAGAYLNPNEPGRGYAIEVQGNIVTMAAFHYRADGKPVWHLVQGAIGSGVLEGSGFHLYKNGQTLTGAYKPPSAAVAEGWFSTSWSRACDGNLWLPGASAWLKVERFAFGEADACRTKKDLTKWGPGVVSAVPEPTYGLQSQERRAFNVLNGERSRCGFGMLAQDARLDAAANNHRNYLVVNRAVSHNETPGLQGFTGVDPGARAASQGYVGFAGEALTAGFYANPGAMPAADLQVLGLISAPYHARVATDGYKDTGLSYGGGAFVFVGGVPTGMISNFAPAVRSYPCAGSSDVINITYGESPSPFPNEPTATWGPSIVVTGQAIRVTTASITGPSGPVAIKALYGDGQTTDPNNSCRGDRACIIPVPLALSTIYRVRVEGTNNGVAFAPLDFTFKTWKGL